MLAEGLSNLVYGKIRLFNILWITVLDLCYGMSNHVDIHDCLIAARKQQGRGDSACLNLPW